MFPMLSLAWGRPLDFGSAHVDAPIKRVSSMCSGLLFSSAGVVDGVKWQENVFSSWLRTGRTTLTELAQNSERRILSVMGEGAIRVGF